MKVILKEGEFDKLPRPKDFGYQNVLEYYDIPRDTVFDVYRMSRNFFVVQYNDHMIEMIADRFISIEEIRDNKLNQLI
jgi:hypothetical protein